MSKDDDDAASDEPEQLGGAKATPSLESDDDSDAISNVAQEAPTNCSTGKPKARKVPTATQHRGQLKVPGALGAG